MINLVLVGKILGVLCVVGVGATATTFTIRAARNTSDTNTGDALLTNNHPDINLPVKKIHEDKEIISEDTKKISSNKSTQADLEIKKTELAALRAKYKADWTDLLSWFKTSSKNGYARHTRHNCTNTAKSYFMNLHEFKTENGQITLWNNTTKVLYIFSGNKDGHLRLLPTDPLSDQKSWETYKGYRITFPSREYIDFMIKEGSLNEPNTLKSKMESVVQSSVAIKAKNAEIALHIRDNASSGNNDVGGVIHWDTLDY